MQCTIKSVSYTHLDVYKRQFLFHGSVRDNIAYGTFDAPLDDIVAAARTAEAHDFIMELPDGYDTIVGERGQKLSGGQRQRISIARAVLKLSLIHICFLYLAFFASLREHFFFSSLRPLLLRAFA